MKLKKFVILAGVLGVACVVIPSANAVTLTAYEKIEDTIPDIDIVGRDLERTRWSSAGIFEVESDDSVIEADNNVDADFGVVNNKDVSYTHLLNWLSPTASTILGATLEIKAWGVLGGNDVVFADTLNLGPLNDGTLSSLFFSTTVDSTDNLGVIDLLLSDGQLNIQIDKNRNAGVLGRLNLISVFSSKLTVKYEGEDPVNVPEPTLAFGLLGLACVGAIHFGRRRLG